MSSSFIYHYNTSPRFSNIEGRTYYFQSFKNYLSAVCITKSQHKLITGLLAIFINKRLYQMKKKTKLIDLCISFSLLGHCNFATKFTTLSLHGPSIFFAFLISLQPSTFIFKTFRVACLIRFIRITSLNRDNRLLRNFSVTYTIFRLPTYVHMYSFTLLSYLFQ